MNNTSFSFFEALELMKKGNIVYYLDEPYEFYVKFFKQENKFGISNDRGVYWTIYFGDVNDLMDRKFYLADNNILVSNMDLTVEEYRNLLLRINKFVRNFEHKKEKECNHWFCCNGYKAHIDKFLREFNNAFDLYWLEKDSHCTVSGAKIDS